MVGAQTLDVVLGFVGATDGNAYRGAQQGLLEAQAQGEFLGQSYRLVTLNAEAPPTLAAVIATGFDDHALLALAESHPGVPVLNVSNTSDASRQACRPNLLHVVPHAAMLRDALAQWRQAQPDDAEAIAQAWHPAFEKYAAAQLNKRYRETFARAMDDASWAGWAAVKLVSDMVAREQTADPTKLLGALRTQLAFDGQKGIDLSFRDNGQLRQPLLLVAGDELRGEAPVRGVVDVEDLDSLGALDCTK